MPGIIDFAQIYNQTRRTGIASNSLQAQVMEAMDRAQRQEMRDAATGQAQMAAFDANMPPTPQGGVVADPNVDEMRKLRAIASQPNMTPEGREYLLTEYLQKKREHILAEGRGSLATRLGKIAQAVPGSEEALQPILDALQDEGAAIDFDQLADLEEQGLEYARSLINQQAELKQREAMAVRHEAQIEPLTTNDPRLAIALQGLADELRAGTVEPEDFAGRWQSLMTRGMAGGRGAAGTGFEWDEEKERARAFENLQGPGTVPTPEEVQELVDQKLDAIKGGDRWSRKGPAVHKKLLADAVKAMKGDEGQREEAIEKLLKARGLSLEHVPDEFWGLVDARLQAEQAAEAAKKRELDAGPFARFPADPEAGAREFLKWTDPTMNTDEPALRGRGKGGGGRP